MNDAIIIGGGFYGAVIAVYLVTQRGLRRVVVLEQENELLGHASYRNQARVHNGYHYPRSYTTAYRSRINFPRFVSEFNSAVYRDFTKLYAIARRNSKVSARQFDRFCYDIGATCSPAPSSIKRMFSPFLIEEVFLVEECAFDAEALRSWAISSLKEAGVKVLFNARAVGMSANQMDGSTLVEFIDANGVTQRLSTRLLFNCTYSGLNQFGLGFPGTATKLKHEITEIALIEPPKELKDLGITVMDGAFFSIMPFPARGLHSLSHVRYTPHKSWQDQPGLNPYEVLASYSRETRVDRMIRDATRYLPCVQNVSYVDSLFEVKTVLVKNEGDDGRPILFERHTGLPGCFSILGGKIDNIFDVLEELDKDPHINSVCQASLQANAIG